MKKIVYLILLLIWLYIIFYLSNQSGSVSGGSSGGLIKKALTIIFDIFKLSKDNLNDIASIMHNPLREIMHILEYLILGFLVIKNLINFAITNIYIITIFFNFFYAIIDEIHQLFIPGRTFEIFDIGMDMIGTILIIIIMTFINKKCGELNENRKNYG